MIVGAPFSWNFTSIVFTPWIVRLPPFVNVKRGWLAACRKTAGSRGSSTIRSSRPVCELVDSLVIAIAATTSGTFGSISSFGRRDTPSRAGFLSRLTMSRNSIQGNPAFSSAGVASTTFSATHRRVFCGTRSDPPPVFIIRR